MMEFLIAVCQIVFIIKSLFLFEEFYYRVNQNLEAFDYVY